MGLWNDADEVGKELQHKRELEKMKAEAAEKAKEKAQQEAKQHEEDKEQGMI